MGTLFNGEDVSSGREWARTEILNKKLRSIKRGREGLIEELYGPAMWPASQSANGEREGRLIEQGGKKEMMCERDFIYSDGVRKETFFSRMRRLVGRND